MKQQHEQVWVTTYGAAAFLPILAKASRSSSSSSGVIDVVAAMLETCAKVSQKFSETQKKLTFTAPPPPTPNPELGPLPDPGPGPEQETEKQVHKVQK